VEALGSLGRDMRDTTREILAAMGEVERRAFLAEMRKNVSPEMFRQEICAEVVMSPAAARCLAKKMDKDEMTAIRERSEAHHEDRIAKALDPNPEDAP